MLLHLVRSPRHRPQISRARSDLVYQCPGFSGDCCCGTKRTRDAIEKIEGIVSPEFFGVCSQKTSMKINFPTIGIARCFSRFAGFYTRAITTVCGLIGMGCAFTASKPAWACMSASSRNV